MRMKTRHFGRLQIGLSWPMGPGASSTAARDVDKASQVDMASSSWCCSVPFEHAQNSEVLIVNICLPQLHIETVETSCGRTSSSWKSSRVRRFCSLEATPNVEKNSASTWRIAENFGHVVERRGCSTRRRASPSLRAPTRDCCLTCSLSAGRWEWG